MSKGITWSMIRRCLLNGISFAACMALLAACGSPGQAQSTTSKAGAVLNEPAQTLDPDETPEPTDSASTQPEAAGTVTLEIGTATGANDFKYSKNTLEALAGSKIKLKFTNNTDRKDEVGHNWVLVKLGQEASVLANGIAAGDDKDWIDVNDPGIIARTKLVEGGQKQTITFDAPAPGTYTYLCTFPEHYAGGMKGTLTIK